jgi:hypothetical protein
LFISELVQHISLIPIAVSFLIELQIEVKVCNKIIMIDVHTEHMCDNITVLRDLSCIFNQLSCMMLKPAIIPLTCKLITFLTSLVVACLQQYAAVFMLMRCGSWNETCDQRQ